MRKIYIPILASAAVLLSFLDASASTINITTNTDPGTTRTVDNIATWATTGNTMDGISIIVSGLDSTGATFSNSISWADNIGASGDGWSLTMNDYEENTWNTEALWNFTVSYGYTINSLIIDGEPGDTVFDIKFLPETTPGSDIGQEIWEPIPTNPDLIVDALYSNQVMVAGSGGPLGDLYQTLSLSFQGGLTGVVESGKTFTFSLDTDNVNAPVPEPATMLMFGFGLAGLAGLKRRKK